MSYFLDTAVNIVGNSKLRTPQLAAYLKIQEYFIENPQGEALVVLPTGTGKTGLISIAPYGICEKRVLIITPGLVTKQSIRKAQEVLQDNFWVNYDVIFNPDDLPILNEYSADISTEHLDESHIVYSNIHKLVGNNKPTALINRVPSDFFDLIIVDEAHHAPAQSWKSVFGYFNTAKILHVTGTPFRGDNQEVPGKKIHETPLSEVMRDRYVKWLRKETVDAHELFFTMPDQPTVKLSIDDVIELKDKEWVEKCVALSPECSLDVIQHSIKKLDELKAVSPNVPHKILAVGCSIAHAKDLLEWYTNEGLVSVIVHSEMSAEDIQAAFSTIDNNQCSVVISVNMLMEGYDHHFLSILALFRPYRSLNAFAQVVGRILRAIPNELITAFEIDNNGLVVYHKETGLDVMWESFQKEVDRAKHQRVKEYAVTDREYGERDTSLGGVTSEDAFVGDQESYLDDIDFNEIFEAKRIEISQAVTEKIDKFKELDRDLDAEDLEILKSRLVEKETRKVAHDLDPSLIEKRPDQYRKQARAILTKKSQDEIASLLSDLDIDDKGTDLALKFMHWIPYLKEGTPNDGTLVRYINAKLHNKFGSVKDRDNKALSQSIDTIPAIVEELRRVLS